MNSKSILFIFALLALFTLASSHVVAEEKQKRDLEDDELLSDALSLMQKLLKSKEEKEKQRIAESLTVEDVDVEEEVNDEIEIEEPVEDEPVEDEIEEPVVGNPDEKYIVSDEQIDEQYYDDLGPDFEEVEVITVTVEVEEGTPVYNIDTVDNAKAIQGVDLIDGEDEGYEVDVVEGEGEEIDEDVDAGIIGDDVEEPEFNVDLNGLNVVAADVDVAAEDGVEDGEDQAQEASVEYEVDENNLKVDNEEVTYYYTVDEGEYDADEDAVNGVIVNVDTIDNQPEPEEGKSKSGVVGASLAIVGAFGVVAGFGYKYSKRNKRVLLPFHEDLLEKGEFFDKNSAEQHIIPVWAATVKKEENEEEKEGEEKLFEVVYNYEPELPDELKLTVGDKVKIKEIYEDGWAYGYNKTTQLFGTFPSTSLGENFNPESVPQYKPEEVAVEVNDNLVEELKKKIVEGN